MKIKTGDLVFLQPARQLTMWGNERIKTWSGYPEEYGYHKVIWMDSGTALVLQKRKTYYQILFNSHVVWIESHQVGKSIQ